MLLCVFSVNTKLETFLNHSDKQFTKIWLHPPRYSWLQIYWWKVDKKPLKYKDFKYHVRLLRSVD